MVCGKERAPLLLGDGRILEAAHTQQATWQYKYYARLYELFPAFQSIQVR